MGELLSIDEARAAVLAAVRPLADEAVAVGDALGRVLAEDVVAAHAVPPFDNSAMDGFLVPAGPAGRRLTVTGESRAGAPADRGPGAGEAVRISTGALVPPDRSGAGGATVAAGVLPVEQAEEHGDRALTTRADTRPAQHVRRAGEDVAAGATVLRAGATLDPAAVGVAVVAGRAEVRCARRPRVAILSTGDELQSPGAPLGPGQIHNSNALTLAALATAAGAEVVAATHVDDDPGATRDAIAAALARADVLVLSGGVSVGPHDHVKGALDRLGVEQVFWRVALRPGKPTWFGTQAERLVFGLPGNPVSAMVTFLLFARPALARLQGADPSTTRVQARTTEALPRLANRDEAVRVRLAETPDGRTATPTGPQGSHQLTSMLDADGLALVPAGDTTLPEGAPVTVELL